MVERMIGLHRDFESRPEKEPVGDDNRVRMTPELYLFVALLNIISSRRKAKKNARLTFMVMNYLKRKQASR